MRIGQTVQFVHYVITQVLGPGEVAVDATVGNGHDTLFLARIVGPRGAVHGFDIQGRALLAARKRLEAENVHFQVTLHHQGHERMAKTLPQELHGHIGAVIFNLGFLPGSDGAVITRAETTCQAIDQGLRLLRPGGIMGLVLYTGHPGGPEEADGVLAHCAAIPNTLAEVMRLHMHNHADPKVHVLLLEKH